LKPLRPFKKQPSWSLDTRDKITRLPSFFIFDLTNLLRKTHTRTKLRSSSNFRFNLSSSFGFIFKLRSIPKSTSYRFVFKLQVRSIPNSFYIHLQIHSIPKPPSFKFVFNFVTQFSQLRSTLDLSSISQAWISTFRFIFILSSLNFNIQNHLPQLGIWNLFIGLLYVLNPKSIWYDIWMCMNRRKIKLIWNLNVYELPQNRFDMKVFLDEIEVLTMHILYGYIKLFLNSTSYTIFSSLVDNIINTSYEIEFFWSCEYVIHFLQLLVYIMLVFDWWFCYSETVQVL
jgi:hypothetical protein